MLYEKPLSEKELVVCVDEKPVVLHADVRPPRPTRPRRIARRDSEYKRQGTANVLCREQPKAGKHFTKATPNRSSPEFADYLVEVAASYPQVDPIHLVMDKFEYAQAHSASRAVRRGHRRLAVGPVRRALHTDTGSLCAQRHAESSAIKKPNQPVRDLGGIEFRVGTADGQRLAAQEDRQCVASSYFQFTGGCPSVRGWIVERTVGAGGRLPAVDYEATSKQSLSGA